MNEEVRDREDRSPAPGSALITQASPDQMQANMERMKAMIELKKKFLQDNLVEGIERDYAVIPGTQKRSLLKPGAEKLLDWHGYSVQFVLTAEKEDLEIGLFAYTYRCVIKQKGSNVIIADCEGDASSYESKYRFEWKYDSELPKGVDKETLTKKQCGTVDKPYFKYQFIVANAADKRNTIRKMAQKRALIGATVLATATSDLFAADADPDDPDATTDAQNTGNGESHTQPTGDYGGPISDKQGKRLYAIRKNHNIADGEFKTWLKAKYGIDDDRAIGYKIYEEICKACESGHLEMPASKPAADPTPAKETAQPASGGKISIPQIKDFSMLLGSLKKSENQFKEWLAVAYPQMAGWGINDLMSADVDKIKSDFQLYCQGEAA